MANSKTGGFRRHIRHNHEIVIVGAFFVQGAFAPEPDTQPTKTVSIHLGQSVGAAAVHDVYADAVNACTGEGYRHVEFAGLASEQPEPEPEPQQPLQPPDVYANAVNARTGAGYRHVELAGIDAGPQPADSPYQAWASDNLHLIQGTQESSAISWLQSIAEHPPAAIVADGRMQRLGKKSPGSPCYWARWKPGQNGIDYLSLTFSTFSHGGYKESWSGGDTVKNLWDRERGQIDHEARARRDADMEARAKARQATAEKSRQQDTRKLRGKAGKLAGFMWNLHALPKSGKSAYLRSKGVQDAANAAKISYASDHILLPIQDADGVIHGVQRISVKSKLIYGRKKGHFAVIGKLPTSVNSPVEFNICEGLTTGLSIHAAVGGIVIVALDAGNLEAATATIKAKYPKAKFVFWADNDCWKPQKGNPGLEKASHAALKFNGTVVMPDFTGLDITGKPTDFNDLAALAGLDKMRGILARGMPDPAIAFKGMSECELKRIYSQFSGCNIRTVNAKRLPDIEIGDGVYLFLAGIGSGKTFQAFKAARAGGGRSIYLSHLIALAEDAANKDERELYHEHNADDLRLFPHISMCLNSLPKLSLDGAIPIYDTVIIDEIEQQLRRLTTKIDNKNLVLSTLRHLIKNARRVICLDAHIGKTTLNFLKECRPGESFNAIINEYQPGTNRGILFYESAGALWRAALSAIGTGQRVFMTFNSKKKAHGFFLKVQKDFPEKKGLFISGDNGGNTQVKAFFRDVNGQARLYDFIVCTPSVSTGVSIDSIDGKPAFDFVGGCFSHQVNTPADCLQGVGRVRDTKEVNIYVSPARTCHIRNRAEITAKWESTHKWDSELLGIDADGCRAVQNPLYSAICADVGETEGFAKTNFRLNFMLLCHLDGYTMSWSEAEADKVVQKEAKGLEGADYLSRIVNAPNISKDEHGELAHKNRLSMDETARKTKHEIQEFYQVSDPEELPGMVADDRRGELRRQINKLEIAIADNDKIAEMSKPGEDEALVPDVRHYAVEREFYSRVLEVAGIGPDLENAGTRYSTNDMTGLVSWIEEHREALSGVVRLPTADRLASNCMRYVGTWLKAMGVRQVRAGKNRSGEYMADANSLAFMRMILDKRSVFPQEKQGTLSSITIEKKTPESVPIPDTTPSPISDDPDITAYHQGMVEFGALASWGG
ncbi:MAG: hypothetical protein GY862_39215 [Gammaproteobacteria bacterium]|nr:hypothetical protein [Gammaproteobacteria bacterium]